MNTLNKPQSYAVIAKEDQVRVYFGERKELHGPNQLNQLQNLQNENPDKQIVFANPFHNIFDRFDIPDGQQRELTPLLSFVSKNQNIKQLTRKDIITALGESQKTIGTDQHITPFEALEKLHAQTGIIEMTRSQAQQLLPELMEDNVEIDPSTNPQTSNEDFKQRVRDVQTDIADGNISQAVISRLFKGKLKHHSPQVSQGIFNNLLNQYGEYMSFLLVDGETGHTLVGASPERHISVTPKKGFTEIRRNALAGTLPKTGLTPENYEPELEAFLRDPKEINELAQVTDEDAKSLAPYCEHGRIIGPILHETGAVIHTGYEFVGRSQTERPPLEYLKGTQHAATLVGSPIESSLHTLHTTEEPNRGFYGGEIGILKPNGELDSAITIRTAEIKPDREFLVQSGAGVVRDSDPEKEMKETIAKAKGIIKAITDTTKPNPPLIRNQRLFKYSLNHRNRNANSFLLQQKTTPETTLAGHNILIINNEDNFAYTQEMMIKNMGADVKTVDTLNAPKSFSGYDMVLLGPGPGDINDLENKRIQKLQSITQTLSNLNIPTLGICLGHQALCQSQDMEIKKEPFPKQGEQTLETVFGKSELLGSYNSFSPLIPDKDSPAITHTPDSKGRSMMIDGPNFVGAQFHPESIMTKNGYNILKKLVLQTLEKGTLKAKVAAVKEIIQDQFPGSTEKSIIQAIDIISAEEQKLLTIQEILKIINYKPQKEAQ